ncbi:unnamed protein product [Peronospora belbahrii]|uniref:Uncharacterized protein n=1 Tax=Peronospora belbahrii TaxID=622444 RepID=A0ABN8CX74_9STRA|nr:unnamed protein product [Peronospora belbahrii]
MTVMSNDEMSSLELRKLPCDMRELGAVVIDEYGTFDVSMIDVGSEVNDMEQSPPSHSLFHRVYEACLKECHVVWLLVAVPLKLMTYKLLLFHTINFILSSVAVICILGLYLSKLPLLLVTRCRRPFRRTESWILQHFLQLDCLLLNFISPQGEHVIVHHPFLQIQYTQAIDDVYTRLYFGGVKLLAAGIPGALATFMFVWSLENVVMMVMHKEQTETEIDSMNGQDQSGSNGLDMMNVVAIVAIYTCVLLLHVLVFISRQLTIFFCSQYVLYAGEVE